VEVKAMSQAATPRSLAIFLGLVLGTPAALIAVAVWLVPTYRIYAALGALVLGLVIGFLIASVLENDILDAAAQAKVHVEQKDLENKIDQKKADTVDIALLNMRKLDEYYNLNKQQARRSFNSSIAAVVVGFATILLSVRFVSDPSAKFASALAGVLGQFIGACFFYLYNKSLNQLNLFYGKLISLQNTMLALQLCEKLTTSKEDTMKTIALELMSRKETTITDSWTRGSKPPKPTDIRPRARAKAQKVSRNPLPRGVEGESPVADRVPVNGG
jgi:hypothetical protein